MTLEATLDGATIAGCASVSFYAARLPTSGRLKVSPEDRFALETSFSLRTYY